MSACGDVRDGALGGIAAAQGTKRVSGGAAGLPDPVFCCGGLLAPCSTAASRLPLGQMVGSVGFAGGDASGACRSWPQPPGSMPPKV